MSNEQYFHPQPNSPSSPTTLRVSLPDGPLDLLTDSGVFSRHGLDLGTRLLLLRAPAPPATGDLLDLGCGVGPIAITLAKRSPAARVWAIDVNERALALCRENATINHTPQVHVGTADIVPSDVRFAAIWSNPPIHIGKAALHELLLRWLPRLQPDGYALCVVQKHLGSDSLQAWLTAQGFPTERVSSAKGYRLLRSVLAPGRAG